MLKRDGRLSHGKRDHYHGQNLLSHTFAVMLRGCKESNYSAISQIIKGFCTFTCYFRKSYA